MIPHRHQSHGDTTPPGEVATTKVHASYVEAEKKLHEA